MLTKAETQRREIHAATPRSHKSALGQFMTPASVAAFMASMFASRSGDVRLLDAGAGLGALTFAVLDRWKAGELGPGLMSVQVHEMDNRLRAHLEESLGLYGAENRVDIHVKAGDYLAQAASL